MIAGINGAGKSALLSAIVKCLSHALPKLTRSKEDVIPTIPSDIKSDKDSLSISAHFKLSKTDVHVDVLRSMEISREKAKDLTLRRDELRSAIERVEKGTKEERELFLALQIIEDKLSAASEQPSVRIPSSRSDDNSDEEPGQLAIDAIAVFYSTSRLLSRLFPVLPKSKPLEPESAYYRALDQLEISLIDFANWYRVQLDSRNKQRAGRMFGQLGDVISAFLEGVQNLQLHSGNPARFSVQKNGDTLLLEQLSDGERGLLALVFDLTRRLAIANPDSDDPITEGAALVMIDEIELHLHPKWQRDVVGKLRSVFKNCQFILTTHSPIVLGEVEARCVRFLECQEGKFVATIPTEAYGMDANRILREYMGDPARSIQVDQELHTLFELIDAEDFEGARAKIEALENQLGKREPELTRAQSLITFLEGAE